MKVSWKLTLRLQAFEWVVRDVSRLRDHIENQPLGDGVDESDGDDEFEILKESPELGDSKFKLEISASYGQPLPDKATSSLTSTLQLGHI